MMKQRALVRTLISFGSPSSFKTGSRGVLAMAAAIGMASCQTHTSDEVASVKSSALNSSPSMPNFVLYAQRSIQVGSHDSVSGGDLGVRSSTTAAFGSQLVLSDHVAVDTNHNLLAPSITLGAHSAVGDVQTNALQNNGASLGAQGAFPASLMPPLPLAALGSGGADVSVPSQQVVTLNPGSYGALMIADHATVSLNPGAYSFTSATIADHTSISAGAAGVTIQVAGSFSLGTLSTISASGAAANKLAISISGVDASASVPVASIGSHASLTALVAAPHGTISIADHANVVGALAAFDIAVSDHVAVQFQSGFPAAPAKGTQQLAGYVTPQIANAPVVEPVPPDAIINLAIGLPIRDMPGLLAFVQQVSDPMSSSYRQYLTVDQFASTYGATPSDYAALLSFATANGLHVLQTFPNDTLIQVSGSAAAIESTFFVNLNYLQRSDGTLFYAPDQEPSSNAPVGILRISGLEDFADVEPEAGSGTAGDFQGTDFATAYASGACASLDGTGQSIGLLELNHYDDRDIGLYLAESSLSASVTRIVIPYDTGTAGPLPKLETTRSRTEVVLDIDVAAAMAPGANILVFQAPYFPGSLGANLALHQMATYQPLANQLSSSWLKATDDNTTQALAEMAAQGQSMFQSSGDFGSLEYNPSGPQPNGDFPIDLLDSRYSVAAIAGTLVGGTNVSMNGNGLSYNSEAAWPNSGGGVFSPADTGGNAIFIPDYQRAQVANALAANPNMGASTVWRNAPDVSMPASNLHYVLNLTDGTIGGTSGASPLWAAYMALVNQQAASNGLRPVGFANPALYLAAGADSRAFNDITNGQQQVAGITGFSAGVGYDLVTGLGSPTCTLIQFLGGGFSSSGGSGGGSSGGESITVAVKGNEGGGPDVCVNGTGYPPGSIVHVQYVGIPGTTVSFLRGPATVASDGTFSLDEFSFGSIDSSCSESQLEGSVTVNAFDGSGNVVTTDIAAEFWCEAGLGGGEGTCP